MSVLGHSIASKVFPPLRISRVGSVASTSIVGIRFARPRGLPSTTQRRHLSFTFAGPRVLDEIIKKDILEVKTGAEIADIWYTYHEARVSEEVMAWFFACDINLFLPMLTTDGLYGLFRIMFMA